MDVWLLSLNIEKCKAVSYGRRPEICTNYNISGEIIEKIESIKDLGVTFDNKLKFDDHINNKNLCGRDGRTICGPQRVRKVHVCHFNSLGGAT